MNIPMDDSAFAALCRRLMPEWQDAIEQADENGMLEVEATDGSLTVTLQDGRQILLSAHAPTRQLWLASPVSGGLHFTFNGKSWQLADGRELTHLFATELRLLSGVDVMLENI